MHLLQSPARRHVISAVGSAITLNAVPVWAQPGALARMTTVVQITDMSASQMDVSKDFVASSRTAWQEINTKGGLRGKPVQHQVLEVDGSATSLRYAVDGLKNQPNVVALSDTVGAQAASQVGDILRRDLPDR